MSRPTQEVCARPTQEVCARPTQEVCERGGVDAAAQGLQRVAGQPQQGVHVAVVEVGQQLLGLLLHHLQQVPLLPPPPHQGRGRGGAPGGRRGQGVPGEQAGA